MRATRVLAVCLVLLAAASGVGRDGRAGLSQSAAWCAASQPYTSVRRDLGIPIRVRAKVASVYYARTSNGRPTFIDLGRAYPSPQRVTLVIWGEDRVNFPRAPERMFRRGQTVCAQGVARLYRGVPQLQVSLWDPAGRLLSF